MNTFIIIKSPLIITAVGLHANVLVIVDLGAVSYVVIRLLAVILSIVVEVVVHHAHFLKLPSLIVHVKVQAAPEILEVRLLPTFERIHEQFEVVKEFKMQIV
jgi:hypothetical protein